MLKSLLIRNYALIDRLELGPDPGLNIVTGETGAGKSIMLGALGLVMGNRADTKALFNSAEKCVVEAVFQLPDAGLQQLLESAEVDFEPDCILRREIAPSGKSRAFINDTPVSLDVLRQAADALMDIHSQHDTLQLASQSYQLSVLDAYASLQGKASAMADAFQAYQRASKELADVQARIRDSARERDFTQFQADELEKAAVQPDEVERLELELGLLANAEDIKSRLALANGLLQSSDGDIVTRLKTTTQAIEKAGTYSPTLAALAERMQSSLIELRDIASEVEAEGEKMEFDPRRLEVVQERIGQINLLLKKHGLTTTEGLLRLRESLAQTLGSMEGLDESVEKLEMEKARLHKAAVAQAAELTLGRTSAIPKMEEEIGYLLSEVGMPNARLKVDMHSATLSATGVDQVRILFSANKGVALAELKNVASGGEFSRLMLCLKYVLAGKTDLPTLIFDEIDTGISGEIALRVGRLMARMAERHQLIVITHMPQIAAKGKRHYFVYKQEKDERTYTNLRELNGPDRVHEIAQMIGGANPSKKALSSAKELMGQ